MSATIRFATEADAAAIQAIYDPYVRETPISFEIEPPTLEEIGQRIRMTLAHLPWLVCVIDDQVAGYAYASQHRRRAAYSWAVDVSAYVDPRYQRRGIGRALYTALLAMLEAQGFYSAYAGIALPNPASVGLHAALGFEPVGVYHQVGYKLDQWHDVGWWQRALQTRQLAPLPPTPLPLIRDSEAIAAALARGAALLHDAYEKEA